MSRGIQYRSRIDLSTAIKRQIERIQTGTFLQIVDASSVNAVIGIAIDNDVSDSKFFNLKKNGEIKEGDGFDKFYIRCDAQPGEWVDIIVVEDSDDFYVKNPDEAVTTITGNVKTTNRSGDTLATQAASSVGTSATKEVSASTATNRVWITNTHATATVYWGASGVTTATGQPIAAGATVILDTGADIYLVSDTAATDVRIAREET